MRVVCSYCRTEAGEKPPLDDPRITHGMCVACMEHFRRQWRGVTLSEYLDEFEEPVLVVTPDRRVVAVNRPMEAFMGRGIRELRGLLGGEATECVYARLPEGCGQSIHCNTCDIRNAVLRARDTGAPVEDVEARLERDEGTVHLRVSAYPVAGCIRLVIDETVGVTPRARASDAVLCEDLARGDRVKDVDPPPRRDAAEA